jgi:hypothetical protein
MFPNHYFINYYFTILERIDFKLYFYYFMQAKPLCYAHKVLFKNIFYFENMFATVLKCYFKFYKTFAIGLKSFVFKMQKLWRK